ncbi:MAG TPA: hypothetical protein VG992_02755 [Candidatus Saccharimonadales bacterium]|nr:hypothetical protein [Candidatus Saccharimonadales bacterium]
MNSPQFTINFRAVKRVLYVMLATLLSAASLPLLEGGQALAATNQMQSRSIQMSDSAISGTSITSGIGSGTDVTYEVSFTTADTTDSIVINFCDLDPIIGDDCALPAGMTLPTAVSAVTGHMGNWTLSNTTDGTGIELTDTAGTNSAAAGAQVFDLEHITNTTAVGSFYARMYAYTSNTNDYSCPHAQTTPTNCSGPGTYIDYGGIALSTTHSITITARVQETLTFCVTKADPNNWNNTTPNNPTGSAGDCSAGEVGATANLPALTLGHGSPTAVLDANNIDTGSIWTQLSTNATHGAVINLRNSNAAAVTPCGGLSADAGATCAIPPIGGVGSCTATAACAMTAGTAAFGLFVNRYNPTTGVGTIGTITPTAAYYNSGHCGTDSTNNPCPSGNGTTWYGMDASTTPANSGNTPATNVGNVTSTFGSTVAASTGPVFHFDNRYEFAATAALTTPAGIYTANLNLVATGTF